MSPGRSRSAAIGGILQSSGIYLLAVVVFAASLDRARRGQDWASHARVVFPEAALLSLLLGLWHLLRRRRDMAYGVLAATVLWPVLGCFGFYALLGYALSRAHLP